MGFLTYGGNQEYEFDDRTLAHLKVTIAMKLRRQESFLMSWVNPPERGGGRISIWLAPQIPLAFRFLGSRAPELNDAWISVMHKFSNSSRGLVVLPEAEATKHAGTPSERPTEHP